jgi:hypothetical protein
VLFDEIALCQQAGQLDDTAQLHLAPASAHGRGVQRPDQILRLGLQPSLGESQALYLLDQRTVRARALLFDLLQLGIDLLQRIANGLDQAGNGRLTVGQIVARRALKLAQRGSGQVEKRLVVQPQCFGR